MAETDLFEELDAAARTHETNEAQLRASFEELWKRTEARLKDRKSLDFRGRDFAMATSDPEEGFQIVGHFHYYAGEVHLFRLDEMDAALSNDPEGVRYEAFRKIKEIPLRWLERIVDEGHYSTFLRGLVDHINRDAEGAKARAQQVASMATRPASAMAEGFAKLAQEFGYDRIQSDWRTAQNEAISDPDRAIGLACTLVEDTAHFVLNKLSAPVPADKGLMSLMKAVGKALKLDPSDQAHSEVRQLCQGLTTTVQAVGSLRNGHSEFHGRSPEAQSLTPDIAALAVNGAGVVATFLMRRLLEHERAARRGDGAA